MKTNITQFILATVLGFAITGTSLDFHGSELT